MNQITKLENSNLKLQQENLNLENDSLKMRKLEKEIRKEFLDRQRELELQSLEKIRKKNKVIEEQRKRSISNNKKNLVIGNQLNATKVNLEKS